MLRRSQVPPAAPPGQPMVSGSRNKERNCFLSCHFPALSHHGSVPRVRRGKAGLLRKRMPHRRCKASPSVLTAPPPPPPPPPPPSPPPSTHIVRPGGESAARLSLNYPHAASTQPFGPNGGRPCLRNRPLRPACRGAQRGPEGASTCGIDRRPPPRQ